MAHVFLIVLDRFVKQVILIRFFYLFFSSLQSVASNILNNGTANSTTLADAILLYIQSTANTNGSLSNSVSPNTIDNVVSSLSNVTLAQNTNSSFLMVQPVNQSSNVIVLGASYDRGIGGDVVTSGNQNSLINASVSAAAVLTNQSLTGVISLNMLIIDKPFLYQNINNSTDNKSPVSSVIVAAVQRSGSASAATNISLYFKVLSGYQSNVIPPYLCSFYDTTNSIWNETGCTLPQYNGAYDRYECSCNHLTAFALTSIPSTITGSTQITTESPTTEQTTFFSSTNSVATSMTIITTEAQSTSEAPTTEQTTLSTTTPVYNPNSCNSTSQVALDNGTCVSNSVGQVC
jgi:hypothetical protein